MAVHTNLGIRRVVAVAGALSLAVAAGCGSDEGGEGDGDAEVDVSAGAEDDRPAGSDAASDVTTDVDRDAATATDAAPPPAAVTGDGTIGELVDDTAVAWGVEVDDEARGCITNGLAGSLGAGVDDTLPADLLAQVVRTELPFGFLACGVDVVSVSGEPGTSPLDLIVRTLLDDEDVDATVTQVRCVADGLREGFGAEGLIGLFVGTEEPGDDDDAIATDVFDSCGLDGAAIVGGG